MTEPNAASPSQAEVDAALSRWNQGDYVLGNDLWFTYGSLGDAGLQVEEDAVFGFVVTTQTCDVVRDHSSRPWVEVSPLIAVTSVDVEAARQGRVVQYGYLPALAAKGLVADLDRTMTFNKAVVAQWKREPSTFDERASRAFAQCLARKRARKAFSDDFAELMSPMRNYIKSKHGKSSPEGSALVQLREIRVTAVPNWDAPAVDLTFWFIWHATSELTREVRSSMAARWCSKITATGRFKSITWVAPLISELRADEYVDADRLDLDYLSGP